MAAAAKGDNYGTVVLSGLLVVVHVATRDERQLHQEAKKAVRALFQEVGPSGAEAFVAAVRKLSPELADELGAERRVKL